MVGLRTFWNEERSDLCNAMLLNGATYGAIADVIGTTRNAVAGYVKRQQPPRPERPARKADDQPVRVKRKYMKRHNDGAAPAPMPMPEPVDGGIPTIELTARQCRFVLSADAPWHHCGQDTPLGSAWCEHHRRTVYQPQRKQDAA